MRNNLFFKCFSDYLKTIRTVAKAFLKLGLERYHSVCILGCNSPEWFIADIAAIFAGQANLRTRYYN